MEGANEGLYRSRGFAHLYLAHGEPAARDGENCLNLIGWRAEASPYMVLLAYFGYRQARREQDASRVLEMAKQQCDGLKWPFPVFQYLGHELDSQAVLSKTINNDELTEAHGYIGLDQSLLGHAKEALEHFQWVREYGNGRFVEFRMAIAESARLEGKGGQLSVQQ